MAPVVMAVVHIRAVMALLIPAAAAAAVVMVSVMAVPVDQAWS